MLHRRLGDRKRHQWLQATVNPTSYNANLSDIVIETVTGVTKYPDWIRDLPHKKEPTCSTTTLVKTPCLREVDTLSPKFLFKTRQMLLSALIREASLQREQW